MQQLNRQTAGVGQAYPERVMQFGGGNFLRAFTDWIIDELNNKREEKLGILVIKPTERGDYVQWREQDGLYHVLTKGIKNQQLVSENNLIKSISRIIHPYREWEAFIQTAENPDLQFIISNTTENGLKVSPEDTFEDAPPAEFPAKLTRWLYHRYQYFEGAPSAGCILIPSELLDNNGDILKSCILENVHNWKLDPGFESWIEDHNTFCNTLVDRIVPGVSKDSMEKVWEKIGYQDHMVTEGEPYHLWAIQAPETVAGALPLTESGLNVVFTQDLAPFRIRKVRILNGAHTCMTPVGYLHGTETVREFTEHALLGDYLQKLIFEEIIPTLDLPKEESIQFANDVLDRFRNPFIHHQLISISLNSLSKFKARVLPSLLAYVDKFDKLPNRMVFAFASLLRFYKGTRNGEHIPLKDNEEQISFLKTQWDQSNNSKEGFLQLSDTLLAWEQVWGQDLTLIPGLKEKVAEYLYAIETEGIEGVVSNG